jgi:electron-transferring-flavoprotein dehydrogenase
MKEDPAPLKTLAKRDVIKYLTSTSSYALPKPPQMNNNGNYIVSLQQVVQWLGRRAEELGVEIYAGFGGRDLLLSEDDQVQGVILNDVGVTKQGERGKNFEPGMAIKARYTLLAEGCHGSLSKQVIKKYNLRQGRQHQTYGIGLKELWRVANGNFEEGLVFHSLGYPLVKESYAYGGGFMYHFGENLVSVGLVVGLDYENPYMNPYKEFQKFKSHPEIRKYLEQGECISYGARALNEGGYQSIPSLHFPNGLLLGCSAGFVNVPKIKGTHNAMKSGILAAECVENCIEKQGDLKEYDEMIDRSWIVKELRKVRNVRPSFKYGFWPGLILSGLSTIFLKGNEPWTIAHPKPDHESLTTVEKAQEIKYPKADGKISFELLESVARTGTNHNEDQPSHLQLKKGPGPQLTQNLPKYGGPEQRFCPAGVYEYVEDKFVINAQNCIHCKTCDIKDPSQNINWVVPEGGGGPSYTDT